MSVNSPRHENQEVHLPLPVKHVECLVGALDQVEIRLGGNTDSVTDCRHGSPLNKLRGEWPRKASNAEGTPSCVARPNGGRTGAHPSARRSPALAPDADEMLGASKSESSI